MQIIHDIYIKNNKMNIVKGGLLRSESDRQGCQCSCTGGPLADAFIAGVEVFGCACGCPPHTAATEFEMTWLG